MVTRYLFPPNLALICVMGSAKTGFMDDERLASDNCSSAMQQNKAELKTKSPGDLALCLTRRQTMIT